MPGPWNWDNQGKSGATRYQARGTEAVNSSAERKPSVPKISTMTAPGGGQRISHMTTLSQMPVTITSLTSNQPYKQRLKAKGEGSNRGWDGWVASPTQRTRVWANSGRSWRTGKPGVLQSMGTKSWKWLGNWTTTMKRDIYSRVTEL